MKVIVDLENVVDDQVKIVLYPAQLPEGTAEYVMPAVIPGSYHRKDFGRFVNRICAYTKTGKKMSVKKLSTNVFKIKKANQVDRIEYWVNDTWDADDDNFIFQPGGTNIHEKQNFVINHQGFYGYFEGQKMLPYKITYKTPAELVGFSPLKLVKQANITQAVAANYVRLVDNPILFAKPDTLSFKSGNLNVHIGIYSETKVVKLQTVKEAVEPLAKALSSFFGTIPVSDYYFIMYFPKYAKTGVARYGGFGALEHSYCSFYFIPEIPDKKQMIELLQAIAGHEFLHILTPLNMHSEEIEFFDFRNPKMSQHLWMYEGVTEYFSHLIRIQNKLMSEDDFIGEMNDKILNAADYANVSFTEMSKHILTEQYQSMYANVYEKGALIAFLLDIYLNELSEGKKGLREVMMELAAKYGPEKPFKDDELIPQIVASTYPEINEFFSDYVIGNKNLPFKNYFNRIGWNFYANEEVEKFSFGKIYFFADKTAGQIEVLGTESGKNSFGMSAHDILLEVNGEKVSPENYSPVNLIEYPENGTEVSVKYKHGDQIIEKKIAPKMSKELVKFYIRRKSNLNENQLKMRKWMFYL